MIDVFILCQGLDLSQNGSVRFLQALGPVMAGMQEVESMIEKAIESFTTQGRENKVVVIMDGMDFMMAALGLEAWEMLEMIGRFRVVSFLLLTFPTATQLVLYRLNGLKLLETFL